MSYARMLIEEYTITANKILVAAAATRDRKGPFAYISSTYQSFKKLYPREYAMSLRNLDHFKQLILKMHFRRELQLAEADMPQTLDRLKLRMSILPHRASEFVFVRVPQGVRNEISW